MTVYNSHPAGPFEHIEAVGYVRNTYGIPARDVAELLLAAASSPSGMAKLPVPGSRRHVWATHMVTQGGRFMVEVE
jgi:hypothetical protein